MVLVADITEVSVKTLQPYVGAIVARSIAQVSLNQCGITPGGTPPPDQMQCFITGIENGVRTFLADRHQADECMANLRKELLHEASPFGAPAAPASVPPKTLVVEINEEYDIVSARGVSKDLCAEIGFPMPEQIKIATIVSELARNIVQYVGKGRIELSTLEGPRKGIQIVAIDKGAGIPNADVVFSGDYKSKTGMGVGLLGTKRLMDEFDIDSGPSGTKIVTRKYAL